MLPVRGGHPLHLVRARATHTNISVACHVADDLVHHHLVPSRVQFAAVKRASTRAVGLRSRERSPARPVMSPRIKSMHATFGQSPFALAVCGTRTRRVTRTSALNIARAYVPR